MIALAATALCLWFIAYLFRTDPGREQTPSLALWVPLLWMFFAGSRYLSSWLNFDTSESFSYDEGSPLDRAVFLALIAAGLVILARRKLDWRGLLGHNKLLLVYLTYCLLSTTWSDEPFISFKRWFKDLGNPIMALVILTEPVPLLAASTVIRRLSYLLIPLSVLFVRYYPELGRVYGVDGTAMYTGVGHQKNALGQMCLVCGIYLAWQFLQDRDHWRQWSPPQRLCLMALLAMLAWLLYMSNSQTSLVCLSLAIAILLCARLPFVQRRQRRLITVSVLAGALFFTLQSVFNIKDAVIAMLGRDPSLTSRTDLWALLVKFSHDPVLGVGFMSFWTGQRMEEIWSRLGSGVVQAHSGYLEQFLNLGYVGLALTVMLLLRGFFKLRHHLDQDASFSILRLCYLLAAALSNYTEASFYGVSNMWVVLLLALIDVPKQEARAAKVPALQTRPLPQRRDW